MFFFSLMAPDYFIVDSLVVTDTFGLTPTLIPHTLNMKHCSLQFWNFQKQLMEHGFFRPLHMLWTCQTERDKLLRLA